MSKARKPRAPKAHVLADPVPEGEILTDIFKKPWRVGPAVGSGGFGLLYLAERDTGKSVSKDAEYVVKVEPHANGPLFCELHFYQRVAKQDLVHTWQSSKKLKHLGVPLYIASGSHERKGCKYRFMIMQRYGMDLQKKFEACKKVFPRKTVLTLGLQLLDILEYIHGKEYVHADIKASNLLLGHAKGTTEQVYLVDYGLAHRYTGTGGHKDYKEDPKRKHDGTIEFTSRDAHKGVAPSRRGDLEILGYCLVQWCCGKLPWENKLNDKDYVAAQKVKYMKDIPLFLKTCLPKEQSSELQQYLDYVNELEYEEEPDYNHLRKILSKSGCKASNKLVFQPSSPKKMLSPPQSPMKRKSGDFDSPVPKKKKAKAQAGSSAQKAAPKSSRGRAKVTRSPKSPASSRLKASTPVAAAARSPRNGDIIPGLENGKASRGKAQTYKLKRHKGVKQVMTVATQTSPGLKGLQNRRKRAK